MNNQALVVRRESGNERTAHHLSGKERLLERHHDEVAPRLVGRVAHADDGVSALSFEGRRGPDHEIVVRRPRQDIARVCRFQRHRAGFEIDPVDVESLTIAQIERDEDEARMLQIG